MTLFSPRRPGAAVALGVVVLALSLPAAPAAADESGEGWVRLGHFSPDTKEVDVRLTALRGGSVVLDLDGVGYGDISPYGPLDAGTYAVAMVPAGSDAWATPTISARITVTDGSASTVAAYGPNSDLEVRSFPDDLAEPAPGKARIRLIQASTRAQSVDVSTTTGIAIASDARPGTATSYTDVDAAPWTFRLSAAGATSTADISPAAGTTSTLFVLDTADGGLTILPVLDAAASTVTPEGGVQTGGGWLARRPGAHDAATERLVARMLT